MMMALHEPVHNPILPDVHVYLGNTCTKVMTSALRKGQ